MHRIARDRVAPAVRSAGHTAHEVGRDQVARQRARRRQRQAKLRAWRPRPDTTRRRLVALLAALVIAFIAVGARLVDLQAIGRERYAQLGLDQRVRTVHLAAERGSVFDRNGHDLASSVPQQTVWANPRVVRDPGAYAAQLAPIVGEDESTLRDRLAQHDKGFVYIARKVDGATAMKVKALALPGVDFVSESKRFYPDGSLAAPVLGFVGTDNNGLAGLETEYDHNLSGKRGVLQVERDPQGRQLPGGERQVRQSERGGDLVLTIDQGLQYEAEQLLTDGVTSANAKGGMAIVLDVATGNVLAMANVEGAGPGHPARPAPADQRNRPVVDVYEPGSTNKVITVAGALQDGVIDADTKFPTPSQLQIGGTEYEDEASHPASMNVHDIVRLSSNVGTIQIARKLGKERFDAYLRAFGFGQPTGLGFPGEANGLVLPLSQYTETSMASMPIGNGLAVTAMQMLDVYTTIANGGSTRPPRLVAATLDKNGARHDEPSPETRQVVSPENAATVRSMLKDVVANGTGTKAQIAGYDVAGKTGTARKPPYDKPPYKYVASFAGFAPADSPRLSAIVVLDEPQNDYFGGSVAAPVFSRVMEYALRMERVPPTNTVPMPAPAPYGAPAVPADTLTHSP
ncbi:MAG TPA: penicillin-binding protein 2 [Acidimicrobiia bacterium]|nr:penicillin-binding protein 2 [Acidimicrobiia bacterium]